MDEKITAELLAEFAESKRSSVGQLLMRAGRLFHERAMEKLAHESEDGLSLRASHFAVFPHLTIEGDRVNTLAEKVDVTKQSMSQTLIELEEHRIVRRVPDPSDGRARLVQLTAEGIRKFGEGLQLLGEVEAELKPALSAEELAELRALLVQVIETLDGGS